jgi:hypothetical protein
MYNAYWPMKYDTPAGAQVRFRTHVGGDDATRGRLKVDEVYTVLKVQMFKGGALVWLKEYPAIGFNADQFSNLRKPKSNIGKSTGRWK